jgi:hypothetical protein
MISESAVCRQLAAVVVPSRDNSRYGGESTGVGPPVLWILTLY